MRSGSRAVPESVTIGPQRSNAATLAVILATPVVDRDGNVAGMTALALIA